MKKGNQISTEKETKTKDFLNKLTHEIFNFFKLVSI